MQDVKVLKAKNRLLPGKMDEYTVKSLGFGVQGLEFRVQRSGFRVQGSGFRA